MPTDHPATAPQVAVRASDTTLFASLELSKARWLVTVCAPGTQPDSALSVWFRERVGHGRWRVRRVRAGGDRG